MRGHFSLSLCLITDDDVVVIYWKPFVRIDGDTEETGILKFCVNENRILLQDNSLGKVTLTV